MHARLTEQKIKKAIKVIRYFESLLKNNLQKQSKILQINIFKNKFL